MRKYRRPSSKKIVLNISHAPATPMCTVHIGSVRTKAVIDTGADCSVIRHDIYKRIPHKYILSTSELKNSPCVSATGNSLDINCKASFRFRVGPVLLEHTFMVAKNLKKPLILGSDFLDANRTEIQFHKKQMVLMALKTFKDSKSN